MRLKKTATLTEVLAQDSLAGLRARGGQTARLDNLLGFYLDARLRQCLQVASYHEGILTLTAANATVAGQLRYLSRIYIQQLRQHHEFCELKRIQAVISPTTPANQPESRTKTALPRLSPGNADLLLALAGSLEEGEVSEALRRLARHVEASPVPAPDPVRTAHKDASR